MTHLYEHRIADILRQRERAWRRDQRFSVVYDVCERLVYAVLGGCIAASVCLMRYDCTF